ncbi:MAG: hypothetical protein R2815_14250 [Flavobacteriales bacterium]|nr:hypothetical protein [Flavobacteriales bacterium]
MKNEKKEKVSLKADPRKAKKKGSDEALPGTKSKRSPTPRARDTIRRTTRTIGAEPGFGNDDLR